MRRGTLSIALLGLLIVGCAEFTEGETKASVGLASSASESGSSGSDTATTGASTDMSGSGGMTSGTSTGDPSAGVTTNPTTGDPATSTSSSGEPETTGAPITTGDTTGDPTTTGDGTTGAPECAGNAECPSGFCDGGKCKYMASCLDLFQNDNGLADGAYMIDPDGEGGGPPFETFCDMGGGGWSCVYFNDFEDNAEGWMPGPITECDGDRILGGYDKLGDNTPTKRTFDLLGIPHTSLRVRAEFWAIDSWDGEELMLLLDDSMIWSKSCGCGVNKNLCGGLWWDGKATINASNDHGANAATLTFTSTLNESKKNESFGIDDISVCIR